LPIIFDALKARGYHVVHVEPASPDHPATPTKADQWRPRREATQARLSNRIQ
jgi:hypothetical protein